MRVTTINLPNIFVDAIRVLTDLGYYESRSQAVRQALKQFLTNEAMLIEELIPENFKEMKEQQMKAMLEMNQ